MLFIKFIFLSIIFPEVFSINCYQCNSSINTECNELFDSKNSNLKASSCNNVHSAKFCIKTTGIYGGLMGTQRFCSSRDFGNYCEYLKRNGDQREQRSCVYTCSKDECNNSLKLGLNQFLLLIISYLVLNLFKKSFNK